MAEKVVTFGKLVRGLRLKHGIESRRQLARLAGVGKTEVSEIERNRGNPGLDIIKKLADFFGVSVRFFFEEDYLDISLDEALSREALRTFVKTETDVGRELEFRLLQIAREGAGPPTPEGWRKLAEHFSPHEPSSGIVTPFKKG